MLRGDGDRPADWIDLSNLDGRRLGTCLDVAMVERYAERYPDETFKAIAWLAGRVNGRLMLKGAWSRRVR